MKLVTGSLEKHIETQHDVFRSMVLSRDLLVWDYPFPGPGCPGTATTKWGLRRHFNDWHPMDLVDIPGEGVYPKCNLYGIQTNFASEGNSTIVRRWQRR